MARVDTTQTLYFAGLGLGRGDRIKFVRSNADSCHSKWDMTRWVGGSQGTPTSPIPVWGRLHFPPVPGPLILCYRFMYAGKPWMSPSAYIMYPNIRINVVKFDKITPNGTAVNCTSDLTIEGRSFTGLGALTPAVTCGFGPDGQKMPATVVNDTHITCTSKQPRQVGDFPIRIDFGSYTFNDPYVFKQFKGFTHDVTEIHTVAPGAGSYQFTTWTVVRGIFEDFGQPRCRFGRWMGTGAVVHRINASYMYVECDKPPFSNSERFITDAYPVAFTPNAQCPPPGNMYPSSTLVGSGASFRTYNSQVNELLVRSGPSTSTTPLQIEGVGFVFPGDPSGVCRYKLDNGTAHGRSAFSNGDLPPAYERQPLTAISSTLLECPPPQLYGVGFYEVDMLQNGLEPADPTASGTALQFELYDLADVAPLSLQPAGGGRGEPATVTITGTGFRDMGAAPEKGIVCVFSANLTHFASGATNVPARLLSADRLICDMPASVAADPIVDNFGAHARKKSRSRFCFTSAPRPTLPPCYPIRLIVPPPALSPVCGRRRRSVCGDWHLAQRRARRHDLLCQGRVHHLRPPPAHLA